MPGQKNDTLNRFDFDQVVQFLDRFSFEIEVRHNLPSFQNLRLKILQK